MSRETLEYHWGKHHRGYVDNLNKQISGTALDGLALEEIVVRSYNRGNPLPTFNNAAQARRPLLISIFNNGSSYADLLTLPFLHKHLTGFNSD